MNVLSPYCCPGCMNTAADRPAIPPRRRCRFDLICHDAISNVSNPLVQLRLRPVKSFRHRYLWELTQDRRENSERAAVQATGSQTEAAQSEHRCSLPSTSDHRSATCGARCGVEAEAHLPMLKARCAHRAELHAVAGQSRTARPNDRFTAIANLMAHTRFGPGSVR
jgi:hypothetical protein